MHRRRASALGLALTLGLAAQPLAADPARVLQARAAPDAAGTWTFHVTLVHADSGWDDYADAWRVEMPDGRQLGTRVLLHPHVTEQPFTRSLSGVSLPEGTAQLLIRTRTTVEGWAATPFAMAVAR